MMTEYQKKKIYELKNVGLSNSKIAAELEISVNTVKSFLRRNPNWETQQKEKQAEQMESKIEAPTINKMVQNEVAKELGKIVNQNLIPSGNCLACGKPVHSIPGRRPKKFCNYACRMDFWHAHKDMINWKTQQTKTCPVCGEEFTVNGNKEQTYCSRNCYIRDRFHNELKIAE